MFEWDPVDTDVEKVQGFFRGYQVDGWVLKGWVGVGQVGVGEVGGCWKDGWVLEGWVGAGRMGECWEGGWVLGRWVGVASKLYGVNATIIIFVFVLYCIVLEE